jgi:hypothetical protein
MQRDIFLTPLWIFTVIDVFSRVASSCSCDTMFAILVITSGTGTVSHVRGFSHVSTIRNINFVLYIRKKFHYSKM